MGHASREAPQQSKMRGPLRFLFQALALGHFLAQRDRALLDALRQRGLEVLERGFSLFAGGNIVQHGEMQPWDNVGHRAVFDVHQDAILPTQRVFPLLGPARQELLPQRLPARLIGIRREIPDTPVQERRPAIASQGASSWVDFHVPRRVVREQHTVQSVGEEGLERAVPGLWQGHSRSFLSRTLHACVRKTLLILRTESHYERVGGVVPAPCAQRRLYLS